ncbi:hypothetical protein D3C75_784930 [compost metagenome]
MLHFFFTDDCPALKYKRFKQHPLMLQQIDVTPDHIQKSHRGLVSNSCSPRSRLRPFRGIQQAFCLAEDILQLKFLAQTVLKIHLERRLLHVFFAQLREHGRYIAVKKRIRREQQHLVRLKHFAVFIEKIGHALQRS